MLIQQILLGISLRTVLTNEGLLLIGLMLEQLMIAQTLLIRKGSATEIASKIKQGWNT